MSGQGKHEIKEFIICVFFNLIKNTLFIFSKYSTQFKAFFLNNKNEDLLDSWKNVIMI